MVSVVAAFGGGALVFGGVGPALLVCWSGEGSPARLWGGLIAAKLALYPSAYWLLVGLPGEATVKALAFAAGALSMLAVAGLASAGRWRYRPRMEGE